MDAALDQRAEIPGVAVVGLVVVMSNPPNELPLHLLRAWDRLATCPLSQTASKLGQATRERASGVRRRERLVCCPFWAPDSRCLLVLPTPNSAAVTAFGSRVENWGMSLRRERLLVLTVATPMPADAPSHPAVLERYVLRNSS